MWREHFYITEYIILKNLPRKRNKSAGGEFRLTEWPEKQERRLPRCFMSQETLNPTTELQISSGFLDGLL